MNDIVAGIRVVFLSIFYISNCSAECEKQLVQDAQMVAYRDDILSAVMDLINRSNFSVANANNQLEDLFPELDLPAGATFDDFKDKKAEFRREFNYEFPDVNVQDYLAARLAPAGQKNYIKCLSENKKGIYAYVSTLSDSTISVKIGFNAFSTFNKAYNVVIRADAPFTEIKLPDPIPDKQSVEIHLPRDSSKTILVSVNSQTEERHGDAGTSDVVTVPRNIKPMRHIDRALAVTGSYGFDRGSGHCKDGSDPGNISRECDGKTSCSLTAGPSLCSDGRDPSPGDPKTLNIQFSCGIQSANTTITSGTVELHCPPLRWNINPK